MGPYEGDNDLPDFFGENEGRLYDSTFGFDDEMANDDMLQLLYHEAFFDFDLTREEMEAAQQALNDYCMDEYDFDFDENFDWEEYRDYYSGD